MTTAPDPTSPRKPRRGPSRRTGPRDAAPTALTTVPPESPEYSAFVEVAIPASSSQVLTYGWTSGSTPEVGQLVHVTVMGRRRVGVVMASVPRPSFPCKTAGLVLWKAPVLPEALVRLLLWVGHYYLCPLPRLIHLVAPGRIWKADKDDKRPQRLKGLDDATAAANTPASPPGLALAKAPAQVRLRGERAAPLQQPMVLSAEQEQAVRSIAGLKAADPGAPGPHPKGPDSEEPDIEGPGIEGFVASFRTILLEGVTGSGKTEVYLAAARRCRSAGRTALILVPEIALTPQMTSRFRAHFGDELAVLHSGLTDKETEQEWYRIALGHAGVVLGVRRGVFVPLRNIGLIIVDEEHDSSYKSDEYPAVHSRDVAIKRAQIEGAVCVLGSASPSLESFANVARGHYSHITLHRRARGAPPQIEVVDSRPFFAALRPMAAHRAARGPGDRSSSINFVGPIIVPQIIAELSRCRSRGEQSMIIVNRRGFANFALCLSCGEAQCCPQCEVTTTLHAAGTTEICHHCGFRAQRQQVCRSCGSDRLETRGFGTQRVQAELASSLPELQTERLDRDVMTSPTRLADVLDGFRKGQFDALIGTQILSKGHDFPRVSLVVVLHLEDALFLPDFRSAERTYQLLLQSAGRAGRAELPGRVLVQSLQPEHPVLRAVMAAQPERFYRDEMSVRLLAGLPPYARQILFSLEHRDDGALARDANALAAHLRQAARGWAGDSSGKSIRIMGPFPAPIERRAGLYRAQIVVTLPREILPFRCVPADVQGERYGTSKLRIDVDPQNFM